MKKAIFCLVALLVASPAFADYFGDFYLGDTINYEYNSLKATDGSDLQRTAAGTPSCVPDGSTTELTAGVTDTGTSAFDSSTGLNKMTVVATSGNGYARGVNYHCSVRASTLNGVTTSYQVFSFSIENRVGSRYKVKTDGTTAAGSSTTTVALGAKISASNIWNGMLFQDLTTKETAVICATTNNGSSDTLSVAGLNTAPGTSDSYLILYDNAPFSCVPFPKVDANGHVYMGYAGTSGSSEVAISDIAAANLENYFDNSSTLATSPKIQTHYDASISADTKLGTLTNLGSGATVAANLVDLIASTRVFTGTADSGTTATLVDAALVQAQTDYWAKDIAIVFTSGSIAGQVVCVSSFNPGTDTLAFTPPTTAAVGTNTYVLIPAPGCDPYR
jgi:hypothetical protein